MMKERFTSSSFSFLQDDSLSFVINKLNITVTVCKKKTYLFSLLLKRKERKHYKQKKEIWHHQNLNLWNYGIDWDIRKEHDENCPFKEIQLVSQEQIGGEI